MVVLIIEDDTVIARGLSEELRAETFTVRISADGREAPTSIEARLHVCHGKLLKRHSSHV